MSCMMGYMYKWTRGVCQNIKSSFHPLKFILLFYKPKSPTMAWTPFPPPYFVDIWAYRLPKKCHQELTDHIWIPKVLTWHSLVTVCPAVQVKICVARWNHINMFCQAAWLRGVSHFNFMILEYWLQVQYMGIKLNTNTWTHRYAIINLSWKCLSINIIPGCVIPFKVGSMTKIFPPGREFRHVTICW